MNDTPNYAVVAEPAIYTEQEMTIVRRELERFQELLETLRTDFNNYKHMIQDRAWNAKRILIDLDHNVATACSLHVLCNSNAMFLDGYNNARVSEVLHLLSIDNVAKLKSLQSSQE